MFNTGITLYNCLACDLPYKDEKKKNIKIKQINTEVNRFQRICSKTSIILQSEMDTILQDNAHIIVWFRTLDTRTRTRTRFECLEDNENKNNILSGFTEGVTTTYTIWLLNKFLEL